MNPSEFVDRMGRFDVVEVSSSVAQESASLTWREGIVSLDSFYAYVNEEFDAHPGSGEWGGGDVSRALFYMQWVSGLWGYGNPSGIQPGRVISNEITGTTPLENIDLTLYLESVVADCQDYAAMLAYFLSESLIPNRLVVGNGHIFNEAYLDGAWWTLDANFGYASPNEWVAIVAPESSVTVFDFGINGTILGHEQYRGFLAEDKSELLMLAANGIFVNSARYTVDEIYEILSDGFFYRAALDLSALPEGPGGNRFESAGSWTDSWNGNQKWYVGDFNGDGKDDILRSINGDGAEILLSTGTGFVMSGRWANALSGDQGWYVGDYNGDGKDDIFRYLKGQSGADMYLSTGSGFESAGSWTDSWNGNQKWYVGDFNGDGKDDILRSINGAGAEILLSTGTTFAMSGMWTNALSGDQGWYVGDYNGDGKDDILRYLIGQSGAEMYLSTGSGFESAGSWTDYLNGNQKWYVADFNGDGKDDILRSINGDGAEVLLSTGSSFVMSGRWANDWSGDQGWYVGDYNVDGKDDIFRYVTGQSGADVYLSTEGNVLGVENQWGLLNEYYESGVGSLGGIDYFDLPSLLESQVVADISALDYAQFSRVLEDNIAAGGLNAYLNYFVGPEQSLLLYLFNNIANAGALANVSDLERARFVKDLLGHFGMDGEVFALDNCKVVEVSLTDQMWVIDPTNGFAIHGGIADITNGHKFEGDVYKAKADAVQYGGDTYSGVIADSRLEYLPMLSNGLLADAFHWSGTWVDVSNADQGWYVGDYNGDGKDDIFRYVMGQSGADIYLSTGSDFESVGSWTDSWNGNQKWYVGDFNGDGKDDILRSINGDGAEILLSTGTGFVTSERWASALSGDQGWYVGDYNGDGKDDIFRYVMGQSGADMYLSTGSGFESAGSWTDSWNDNQKWYVGDFNGDGKDDILRSINGDGAEILLSTGAAFAMSGTWTNALSGDQGWYVGDYNGDGKDDIFHTLSDVGANVLLSTGTDFVKAGNWSDVWMGNDGWYVGDFDGNSQTDIFRYVEGYSGAEVFL